jgi:DNA-binding phage protein
MTMPLTRSFRETVADRAKASPGFRAALIEEAMQALADGDMETARTLLRDVANATLGFQALARETGIPEKSLMRMLGPNGNPSLLNLGSIVRALNKHVGVRVTARVEMSDATVS